MSKKLKHKDGGLGTRHVNTGEVPSSGNRRSRRAAKSKAQQPDMFDAAKQAETERRIKERFAREREARRLFWESLSGEEVELLFDNLNSQPWPHWIPYEYVVHRVRRLGPVFARMPRETFDRYRELAVDSVAFDGSEHLGCDTGPLSKRDMEQKRHHVNQFARSLAMLSCAPGGVKFCDNWFETVDGKCSHRVFLPEVHNAAE